MQVSESDAEMDVGEEDVIPDDLDEPQIAVEDDEEDEEEESDGKEDQLEDDEDEAVVAGPSSVPPRIRIKLKLPASGASSRVPTGQSTPEGSSRRRYIQRDSDVDSENSDSEASDRSTSAGTTVAPGRPLTARQAVLRNVVDSSHVSLEEPPNPRKKKPLTEIEIALKREETARKRKNLSEKKLEDEKAETINRLLKKQSRPRGKRNALATAEDRPTPIALDAEGEEGLEEGPAIPILPTMYRWISTTKIPGGEAGTEPRMVMSFSVPVSVLPTPVTTPATELAAGMDVDRLLKSTPTSALRPPRPVQNCDVDGCDAQRKYRLVKDFQRGACGIAHLKQLEAQFASV
ncbi:hypothetical protein BDW22DRAFT_1437741 [Trametopsis cervina]|nr:hypothetical protein BDW22DRAFT_1437741 [Trametopsis cervina]